MKEEQAAIFIHINKLKPSPDNPRINKHAIRAVANSIKLHGFAAPIVANFQNEILAGHTRWYAMQLLQKEESKDYSMVPVRQIDLTGKQAQLYRIADNKLGELATWNEDMLEEQLKDLMVDFEDELNDMNFELEDLIEEEEIEFEELQIPEKIQTKIKIGDLIEIGPHRLFCGDSTKKDSFVSVMNDQIADVSFTSPPYNAGETPTEITMRKKSKYLYDLDKNKDFRELLINSIQNNINYSKFLALNIQMLAKNKKDIIYALNYFMNYFMDVVIWDKGHGQPAMAKNVFNSCFEFLFFFCSKKNPTRAIENGGFRGTIDNVYRGNIQRNNEYSAYHNATFPSHLVSFIFKLIPNGSIILDSFLGTGTTMLVAHSMDKICYGIEICPEYCQIIIDRMIKLDRSLVVKVNGVIDA